MNLQEILRQEDEQEFTISVPHCAYEYPLNQVDVDILRRDHDVKEYTYVANGVQYMSVFKRHSNCSAVLVLYPQEVALIFKPDYAPHAFKVAREIKSRYKHIRG